MSDRDPVEVEAEAALDNGLCGDSRQDMIDAIATALRTSATRAGEAMREAAARTIEEVWGDRQEELAKVIRALPLSDAPASPWPKELDIGAAEAELSDVLSGYDYEMPADGMRRVIAAALRLPTPPAKDD